MATACRLLCWISSSPARPAVALAHVAHGRHVRSTEWKAASDAKEVFEGRVRGTGMLKWTGTRADLVFGSNSQLDRRTTDRRAYVLKERFGQLWSYEREGWARRFFENAQASSGSGLLPYEKFAEMIDRHWDGIAAYCRLENKVSLGFVEGLNNKIRVIQRRAYGLRDEDYPRLKILTCMLPALQVT